MATVRPGVLSCAMAPIVYRGEPSPEHGGNLPRLGAGDKFYALRETPDGFLHGAAMILTYPKCGSFTLLHTSDDLGEWLRQGWRLTSY